MKTFGGLLCALALLSLVLDALGFALVPLAWRVRWSEGDLLAAHVVLVAFGLTLWLVGHRHARRLPRDSASDRAAPPAPSSSPPLAAHATKTNAKRDVDAVEAGRK